MSGLEVEGIETKRAPKGVVVGKVLKRENILMPTNFPFVL